MILKNPKRETYRQLSKFIMEQYAPSSTRRVEQSKHDYFYFLVNKLGCSALELAYSYKAEDGTMRFSKWVKWCWLQEFNSSDYIKELKTTRNRFIERVSHRSVLDIEIMIDVDDSGEFKTIKSKAKSICNLLKERNIKYSVYFSGSKSYHISFLIPELRFVSDYERTKIKRDFLEKIGGDTLKASLRNLIALEGARHWKTGKIKKEVFL